MPLPNLWEFSHHFINKHTMILILGIIVVAVVGGLYMNK